MSEYLNVEKPRFYTDLINYQMSRGKAQNGNFDVLDETGTITGIRTGEEIELFDLRPLNLVTLNTATNSGNDHVIVNIDVGDTVLKQGFVAILNHNMKTADAKLRLCSTDTESQIQGVDFSGANARAMTEVVNGVPNADSDGTNIITPRHDGSTIVTFSESNDRYWGLQFEGADSNTFDTSTHMTIGCIVIGEFYDMPVAPDLNIKQSIIYDQNKVRESLGGQRYSTMTSFGRNVSATSKSPFSTTTSNQQVFGGRLAYEMSFSYLNSSDLMPSEYDTYNPTEDSFIEDVWNRTSGGHLPFILSVDGSVSGDGNESSHVFARFTQQSLNMNQVAPSMFSVSLKIEEEF